METSQTSTVELISYIEQWIENAQRVVIQGVRLGINTTCPTTIVDFNSLECPQAINVRSTPPPPTVTDPIAPLPGDIGDIIGGVVAGVFVLVVIVAAVIVIVLVGMRHRKTVSKDVQNNKTKLVLPFVCTGSNFQFGKLISCNYISYSNGQQKPHYTIDNSCRTA